MIKKVNNCVGCEVCRGTDGCSNYNAVEYICDDCSEEAVTLYEDEDGVQRCLFCVLKLYKIIE